MLSFARRARVFMAAEPIDFRRGIDSLFGLVRDGFGDDAFTGDLFVFLNRAADRVKILAFDRNGFWLHLKRLERGTFERVAALDARRGRVEIDATKLALILDGIELSSAKSKKHFIAEIRPMRRDGITAPTHSEPAQRAVPLG